MPASQKSKEDIIDQLLATHRKAQKLELTLKFAGKTADANEIKKKNAELSKKIDILIARSMRKWQTTAKAHVENIKAANTKLQSSIRDIKKNKDIAKGVVKALGYLDDAVEIAAKVIEAIA